MLENFTAKLVAKNHRIALCRKIFRVTNLAHQCLHVIAVVTYMQIRAADATTQDFDQYLAFARFGFWQIYDA